MLYSGFACVLNTFYSFLSVTGKLSLSVKTGTLLYVFGSCECHSKPTKEMHISLRPIPKNDALPRWGFYKLGIWQKLADQSRLHDTWKVTHLKLLRQESVNEYLLPTRCTVSITPASTLTMHSRRPGWLVCWIKNELCCSTWEVTVGSGIPVDL